MDNRIVRACVTGLCALVAVAALALGGAAPPPGKSAPTDPTPLAYEGETLVVAAKASEGGIVEQQMAEFGPAWSKNAQALWQPTKVGSTLSFPLLVGMNTDALYSVAIAYTRAPDYGQVQLTVNGAPVGAPFDGYAAKVTHAGTVVLGTVLLKKGPAWNQFVFAVTSKNAASTAYYVGIDQIKLNPVVRGRFPGLVPRPPFRILPLPK